MRLMLRCWCCVVLCVALAGCGGASDEKSENSVAPAAPESKAPTPPPLGAPPP